MRGEYFVLFMVTVKINCQDKKEGDEKLSKNHRLFDTVHREDVDIAGLQGRPKNVDDDDESVVDEKTVPQP